MLFISFNICSQNYINHTYNDIYNKLYDDGYKLITIPVADMGDVTFMLVASKVTSTKLLYYFINTKTNKCDAFATEFPLQDYRTAIRVFDSDPYYIKVDYLKWYLKGTPYQLTIIMGESGNTFLATVTYKEEYY